MNKVSLIAFALLLALSSFSQAAMACEKKKCGPATKEQIEWLKKNNSRFAKCINKDKRPENECIGEYLFYKKMGG